MTNKRDSFNFKATAEYLWTEHVAHVGGMGNECTILSGRRDNIKMERMYMGVRVWTGFVWLRISTSYGLLQTTINLMVP